MTTLVRCPPSRAPWGSSTLAMLPVRVNLVIYQGDDVDLNLDVRDGDGQPTDMTVMAVASQIRPDPEAEPLAAFDPDAHDNTINLYLTSAQTTALPIGRAVWDAQITDPDERVTTLVAGTVTVMPEVTR